MELIGQPSCALDACIDYGHIAIAIDIQYSKFQYRYRYMYRYSEYTCTRTLCIVLEHTVYVYSTYGHIANRYLQASTRVPG